MVCTIHKHFVLPSYLDLYPFIIFYRNHSLFLLKSYYAISMQKIDRLQQAATGRPGQRKYLAGAGRLRGSTACRRTDRLMKNRPAWTSDICIYIFSFFLFLYLIFSILIYIYESNFFLSFLAFVVQLIHRVKEFFLSVLWNLKTIYIFIYISLMSSAMPIK